ncbi:hypothetical protein N0V90_004049 [Neofusicoccum parvum]|nr:hypothetical protein N0V90_004049 [Neofusicoccum parvum]
MLGFKGPGAELLREEDGGKGLMLKVKHAMSPTLLGPGLDSMNEKMIKLLKSSVDELAACQNKPVDIFAWCRHAITTASTYASFGPLNPLADKKVEEALWTFEQNLVWVFVKIFPGKSIQARELLVRAFEEYFQAGGHEDSSDLTLARWKVQRDAGASVNDIARLEISECIAILTNTVPITFWMVFDIYSRPILLRGIRKELHEHALRFDGNKCTIDLTDIREKCALLLSTFQEVLRLRSKASPIRTGTKDVMLNDRYLIKAGSILQMPGPFLGRKEETWGERANEFDPSRFMKGNAENDKNSAKRVSSFLAFGTVPNMCPGRHFASGEVLAVVAMLVLMYDLMPENGEWREPRVSEMAMASSIDSPTRGFNVKVNEREEFRDTEWDFRVTPGKGRFGLITG